LEYNYYQLLGLPVGSDIASIKRAYREAARRYHPDLNPDNQAAEQMMKVLNQGYELLSNPGKKQMYDAFLYASSPKHARSKSGEISKEARRAKAAAILREREQHFVRDFKQRFRLFQVQLVLLLVVWISAPFYAALNWFADEASYDHLLTLLAMVFFLAATLRLFALIWRYLNVQRILKNRPFRDAWIYVTAVFVLVLIPWLVYQGAQWRKTYHLSHFTAYTSLKIESLNHGLLRYSFRVGNRQIEKLERGILWNPSEIELNEHLFQVRYSKLDPRIAEIVLVSPDP
jgi:hypothetical protein